MLVVLAAINRECPAHPLTDLTARRIEMLDTNALEDDLVLAEVSEVVQHVLLRHGTPFRIVASRLRTQEVPRMPNRRHQY